MHLLLISSMADNTMVKSQEEILLFYIKFLKLEFREILNELVVNATELFTYF